MGRRQLVSYNELSLSLSLRLFSLNIPVSRSIKRSVCMGSVDVCLVCEGSWVSVRGGSSWGESGRCRVSWPIPLAVILVPLLVCVFSSNVYVNRCLCVYVWVVQYNGAGECTEGEKTGGEDPSSRPWCVHVRSWKWQCCYDNRCIQFAVKLL